MNQRDMAWEAIALLQAGGFEAALVGGCVRDKLLGREPKDYDGATSAPPDAVLTILDGAQVVGAKFGVALWRGVEVATFRKEGEYHDFRRPSSVTFGTLREDAARRDFTINALYAFPQNGGEIVDFYGGIADLQTGILRTVGEARVRFGEDALRVLRAVRFAAEFGFEIEAQTAAALRECGALLAHVSRERIGDEVWRMMSGAGAVRAVELLREYGLVVQVFGREVITAAAIERLKKMEYAAEDRAIVGFAALLYDEADAVDILRGLRFSAAQIEAVKTLVHGARRLCELHDEDKTSTPNAQLLRLRGEPYFSQIKAVAIVVLPSNNAALRNLEKCELPAPLITGATLAAMGIPPGPAYQKILNAAYDAQLEDRVTTVEEAKETVRIMQFP